MKKTFLAAAACALAVTACSQLREPSDAQLTTLLRQPRSGPTDAAAPLDSDAVACLRVLSGDAALASELAPAAKSDAAKRTCRGKIDGWISQTDRNPERFRFEEVSAPPVVKRAIALQVARSVAKANHEIPSELLNRRVSAPPPALPVATSTVDLGAAGTELVDAENQCRAVSAKAATGSNPRLQGFATFCVKSLRQLRGNMEAMSKAGNDSRLDSLVANARNIASSARNLLADADAK